MIARLMGLKTISPRRLHQLVENGDPATVVDVNGPASWLHARVPGSRNLDPFQYGAGDLPPHTDALVVFYCSNPLCTKAPHAARRARKMGYGNVYVMPAGISGWVAAKLPTESGT